MVPLSHTIIKRLFFLFTFLIIVTTSITYNYLIKKTEIQFHDQLLEYIVQRGKRESEVFRLAKDNLLQLKNEFLFQYKSSPKSDFTDWFESHLAKREDGTMRSLQQYFDGVWTEDGTFEHGIGIIIEPDINVTQEIQRRMGIAYDLILKYGPAWNTRFMNLWFVGPEKVSLIYWPEIPWDRNISADHNWKNDEWFSKTNMENNPSRNLVWTGLYFDSLAGHWIISVALPVDVDGKHIGTIGTDLECGDFFNRNLSDSMVSSYSIILGQDGHIIVHPYKIAEMISSRDPKFTVALAKDKELSAIYKKINMVSIFPTIIDNNENDELLAVTKIDGPDWYLISVYYKALFKDQILKNAYFMIAIGLGSLMTALFMIYSVVRKNISQPLGLLTETAGNFDATTEIESNLTEFLNYLTRFQTRPDELGLLVQTLIKMGNRLKTVYRDIAIAKKNLEAEVSARTLDLVRAKEVAEASNRAKSEFLANMSHELRTPLNVILGFSRLMERDASISPDQFENLSLIHRSGDHLLALINDVLDMSKIESGQVIFNPESFDLLYFLEGITAMFQSRAAERNLLFTFEKNSNIPQYIRTDKGKLRQILFNLLGNAINYTHQGSVILQVSETKSSMISNHLRNKAASDKKTDLWIRFEIRDTGIGIDQKDIDIIFNQFIQVEHRSGKKTGTGLGLTISRDFVQRMGSDLRVQSKKGKGSIFWFDLPIQLANQTDVVTISTLSRPIGLAPNQPRYRILIVEDHEESRIILTKLLRTIGFEVQAAVDGKEGVEMFLRFEPKLVLMDIRMPIMNGLTATKKIKSTEAGAHTPVIALTAHAFEKERLEILAAGCDGFIRKPYDDAELLAMFTQHIGVTFIYEKEQTKKKLDLISMEKALEPGILAQLPVPLMAELESAVVELNFNRTIACIEQIRHVNDKLADTLTALASKFRFEKILTVITRAKKYSGKQ